ncbi:hypothetical protein BI364_00060 [Acidihalobacter yilgarnensis]|uniref:Uroporphyrin-3 C-methyltransferase n=1 Tax=Acidihalobacter yilgarnensis TaxID=2819280 RepID=A0A1D8IJH9_9GAMM|nr:uroporphyrinogen-III C-methyltransferase [Acidihalobacter yilgarnensis]AOU96628.1 hypothetical protein BI364_00060 [Acidihalobacter yilgarnensis]
MNTTETPESKPDNEATPTTVANESVSAASPETSKPEHPEPAPRVRGANGARVALVLAVLALLLLAAGGGAGYWAWMQFRQTIASQDTKLQTLRQALAEKASREDMQGLGRQTDQLATQQEAQTRELQSLGQTLQQSQVLSQRDQRGWVLSEAAYLMRIARYQLDLLHDIHGADDALTLADRRLARLGDADLLPVRQALAAEIQSLRDYHGPDKVGILLQLNQIMSRIVLPTPLGATLLDKNGATTESAAPAVKPSGGFRGFIEAVWRSISEHVSIRHYPQRVSDLAVVTTQAQAAQSLYLYLENARAAVITGDNTAYHHSLAAILKVLQDTSGDTALRTGMVETLDKLNAIDIAPAMPNIGEALTRLKKHLSERKPAQAGGQTP